MERFLRFRRHVAALQRLKMFHYAKVRRLENVPLCKNLKLSELGSNRDREKVKVMPVLVWYHPAVLQLENEMYATVFIHLIQMVHYANSLYAQPQEKAYKGFKDLKEILDFSVKNDVVNPKKIRILNNPYSNRSATYTLIFDNTGKKSRYPKHYRPLTPRRTPRLKTDPS